MMKRILFLITVALLIPTALRAQWNQTPGYRSFYEMGVNIGSGNASKSNFEISTTQGYQIIPTYLYLGTGAGFQAFFNADGACGFPVYVNMRSHFSPGKVSPFFDVKVGYASITNSNWYSGGGFYLNPSIGLRFAVSNSLGLSLRAGYTLEYARVNGSLLNNTDNYGYNDWAHTNIGGVLIQIGLDF